jgi:SAM-dependent methyltransferase
MLFASPLDPALTDGRFYDREGREYYTSPSKLQGDFAAVRFQRELQLFRRYCAAGKVLDVGCGTGAFLHHLRATCPGLYEVLGADVSGPALDHARENGIPVLAEPYDQHFHGATFDAITFWAILEHVEAPVEFVRKAATLLRPGGHCFVLVPNMRSLAVRILGARYRYLMPEHVNYFTRHTLAALGRLVPDFEQVELRSSHFNPVVMGQDLLRRRPTVPGAERAALLNRTNAWKTSPRLRVLCWAYEQTEAVLGRFGLADNLCLVLRRR